MLAWYDKNRRELPWRARKGGNPNPYYVWLSEVMLQQTTVPAVIPYFIKFIERWPDVVALAHADNEEVMSAWAGLGYYARARNMHKCAQIIARDYDGIFPQEPEELERLPGIGEYTSAAIAAIAFDKCACVVDGNIERIMARYHALDIPLPEAKKEIKERAKIYTRALAERPGDYAQSLMDLGSAICRPRSPLCFSCPLNKGCVAHSLGKAEEYPKRMPKKPKPQRFGFVYWIEDEDGNVLVHKRPENGLLGGLYGLPTSSWEKELICSKPPVFLSGNNGLQETGHISHVFTHFSLKLYICITSGYKADSIPDNYKWMRKTMLRDTGFPSVFEKVRKMVLAA